MSRNVIVGAFVVLGIVALFAIIFTLQNIGTQGRYKIGVQFKSASGIHRGALAYESGVNVGVVDAVELQPDDFTVEVIVAVNNNVDIPRDAQFIIQAPLTGDATLEIVPKPALPAPLGIVSATPAPSAVALLPRAILPRAEQPQGINPATLSDLLQEGQGQVKRLDRLLADLERREPRLLDTFQSALDNAKDIAATTNQQTRRLARRLDAIESTLQLAIDTGSANILDITKRVDTLVVNNGGKIDSMLTQFNLAAHTLNETADQVKDLANNPQLRKNLLDTTRGIADTALTFAGIAGDLRKVTNNAQTQAQLRDTIANFDAASQKANSLFGEFGGHSSVYGVDRGATPAPVLAPSAPVASPHPLAPPPGAPTPAPGATVAAVPAASDAQVNLRNKLATIAQNLLAIQVRLGELDAQSAGTNNSPLLSKDRGPQTDFNVVVLPSRARSLLIGANDIGSQGTTSYNLAGLSNPGNGFHYGGGILYSRLGALAGYSSGAFGLDGRLYDPRHPTLDAYATLKAAKGFSIFGGERDVTHTGRRTVLGLQLNF
ncbi:MAG: MlaD family protein [Candidatus Velthaea sp.]|jgi:ABC-type transporter Mla subunit MlaD